MVETEQTPESSEFERIMEKPIRIIKDKKYPEMYRLQWKNGDISVKYGLESDGGPTSYGMYNLTRAKDILRNYGEYAKNSLASPPRSLTDAFFQYTRYHPSLTPKKHIGDEILKETDILTFRNHKGETKEITRQEFRNAARGQQNIDHRPKEAIVDPIREYRQEGTPKERMFDLVKINGKDV